MKKEDILPHLNRFITVTLNDGSNHSGYISNTKEIKEAATEEVQVTLVNGLFVETVLLTKVVDISFPDREETTSLPVKEISKGYGQA